MNKPTSTLTKTCTSCGQEKPLSAFLQITGRFGATYGSICAACRKTEKEAKPKDIEESTRSSTGLGLDAKAKKTLVQDNRSRWQQIEDEFFEERQEKDKTKVKQTQKVLSTAKENKKLRDKHGTFLDSKNKSKPSAEQVFTEVEEEGKIDFASGPVDYMRAPGIKTQNTVLRRFLSMIGADSPFATTAEKGAEAAKDRNHYQPKADTATKTWNHNTSPKTPPPTEFRQTPNAAETAKPQSQGPSKPPSTEPKPAPSEAEATTFQDQNLPKTTPIEPKPASIAAEPIKPQVHYEQPKAPTVQVPATPIQQPPVAAPEKAAVTPKAWNQNPPKIPPIAWLGQTPVATQAAAKAKDHKAPPKPESEILNNYLRPRK